MTGRRADRDQGGRVPGRADPGGVRELTDRGHDVLIQAGAGEGSAISDEDYEAQGARIVPDARGRVRARRSWS